MSRHDARVAANLATLGERGRADVEARLLRWRAEHPTLPCERCAGRGCYTERAGARRHFDHRDFDRAAGDRYEASCPSCRGLGRVFVSPEEARAALERETREARRAYRALRAQLIAEHPHLDESKVDALARRRVAGEPTPAAWLDALRSLASEFGV